MSKYMLLSSWFTKAAAMQAQNEAAATIMMEGKGGMFTVGIEYDEYDKEPWKVWLYRK